MSLNGLDEAKVAEAHQAALAEAGGWFLLKYTTRDTVDLLSRGSGGVAEVRSAITKYEEKSPLYGLVQFRRKKVILKYVPDGTSRLLQVRLTVQFQSVLETFVPHDTVLSFVAPSELTESALTSACMLHPPPMSLTSSSSSLRRQPLGEISEDAEESPHIRGQSKSKVAPTPAPPTTETVKELQKEQVPVAVFEPVVVVKAQPTSTKYPQEVASNAWGKITDATQDFSASTPRAFTTTPTLTVAHSPDKTLSTIPEPTPPGTSDGRGIRAPTPDEIPILPPIQHLSNTYRAEETEPRDSFQSVRPSVIDAGRPSFSNYDSYDPYKPKVKRGPRPHVETETRPQTAGSTKKPQSQRLVANLPNSVRAQNRLAGAGTGRPGSQHSSRSVPPKFAHYSETPHAPPLPSPNHISSLFLPQTPRDRTYSRAGSITSTATAAATPEKLRLMKALQLRKRNQLQAKLESEMPKPDEESKTDAESRMQADLGLVRSQSAGRNPDVESTSVLRSEEAASKATDAVRIASRTSITNVSEAPSTQSSSFVEDNDGATSHASISSDTSSSVTPKADAREAQRRKPPESPVPNSVQFTGNIDVPLLEPASGAGYDVTVPINTPETFSQSESKGPASSSLNQDQRPAPPDEQNAWTDPVKLIFTAEGILRSTSPGSEPSSAEEEIRPPVPSKSMDAHFRRRRAADLEPIKVVSSPELSEASDDDSFMEELQHAQVQEAKPVAVGRSPVTPIYHNLSDSVDRSKEISRTVSSPLNDRATSGSTSPIHSRPRSVRSISTALPTWPPSNENVPPVPLAKKGPLSSGISRRIKALEVFTSSRESSSSPPHATLNSISAQNPKTTLTSSKNRLSFIPGSITPNTNIRNPPPPSTPMAIRARGTEATDYERSKPLTQQPNSAAESSQIQPKGETISVTARIVRNPHTIHGDTVVAADGLQQGPLQRSELTIEHDRAGTREDSLTMTGDASIFSNENFAKSSQTERGRPSFSSYRSDTQAPLLTSESMASRLSLVSGKKRKDKTSFPRSSSDNSSFTEEKSKQSRARRLMQRVSNLSTNSRRNIAGAFSASSKDEVTSDRITEQAENDHDLTSVAESVSHVVDIGDVNVQFPDTLLWKRRFLRIDDQGYLIFTPPTMERNTRNISRKFHLSEFKKPTLPDVEREEMAWSILLDSEDGSCIQCACESKYTQTQVLRMLVDAHSAYHQLYSAV